MIVSAITRSASRPPSPRARRALRSLSTSLSPVVVRHADEPHDANRAAEQYVRPSGKSTSGFGRFSTTAARGLPARGWGLLVLAPRQRLRLRPDCRLHDVGLLRRGQQVMQLADPLLSDRSFLRCRVESPDSAYPVRSRVPWRPACRSELSAPSTSLVQPSFQNIFLPCTSAALYGFDRCRVFTRISL